MSTTSRQTGAGKPNAVRKGTAVCIVAASYTPEPKQHGYSDEMRKQAVQFYVDGMNLRRIARHFGIHHRTVSYGKASAASLPEAPVPKEVKAAEMDELFTFIGNKKTGSTF